MNTNLRNAASSLGLCITASLIAPAVLAAPFTSPHGYGLTLPAGWAVNPNHAAGDDAAFTCHGPGGPTSKMIIEIAPSVPGVTVAGLKAKFMPMMKMSFPHAVLLSQKSSSLGGAPDLDVILVNVQQGKPLRFRQIYALKNNSIYIVTVGYPEKAHARYDAPVAQMLASFHWKA